jgi:hypothetical protein
VRLSFRFSKTVNTVNKEMVMRERGFSGRGFWPGVPVTQDLDVVLPYASHRDDRFKEPQVVFGEERDGLSWDYSDRLWQWDHEKCKRSSEAAKESGAKPRTARFALVMLQYYYDDPNLELVCIMTGFNPSNGYDYYVYGYRRSNTK